MEKFLSLQVHDGSLMKSSRAGPSLSLPQSVFCLRRQSYLSAMPKRVAAEKKSKKVGKKMLHRLWDLRCSI
ncbi:MAG: hypothetical protein UFP31_08580 [Prevotella sp.]|nr:hypothetical protein [Prevotella sp.]